ncbi:MAG: acetyl/propionyl/methylcrotonyl-CoA carboxylase subunit alpha [Candidatus Puniceispirillaceae bacterium]
MFNKILIANRGEIACRIIRTAKKMNIATVAVYSDADAGTPHVKMADEAYHIGGAASADSYLKADVIIEVALKSGAQAIHPGFGFLSENAKFVAAVEAAGLVFIGPGSHAIEVMGDKIESKKWAVKAGVSTVPGTADAVRDIKEAKQAASEIGYPVMVKASAGGGGKGMRVVEDEAALEDGMTAAMNEARNAFGDDRVFIEKFVVKPRHIEIQVLADGKGGAVFLGERECSIQRRHQKVLEEAPSPFISEETRAAMGQQAVALAKAVSYRSAGTVEFIVGAEQDFYFLEMNTRLQVEHPVTELVYDLDLVEWMIRIAAGEVLTLRQADIVPSGWAMEARLYAEDPEKDFLPSIGQLTRYREPKGEGVRVDSGVEEGGAISMFYDPMISKLIAYGKDRTQAINRLSQALDHYEIRGIQSNRQFLASVLANDLYKKGDITTGFIASEYEQGFTANVPAGENFTKMTALATLAVANSLARFEHGHSDTKFVVMLAGQADADLHKAEIVYEQESVLVSIGKAEHRLEGLVREGIYQGLCDGHAYPAQLTIDNHHVTVTKGAMRLTVQILPARMADYLVYMPVIDDSVGADKVIAPMPGLLTKLLVAEGDKVQKGQNVAVIEAMKMENLLVAEASGVITSVKVQEGDNLNVEDEILTLSLEDSDS